MNQITTPYLPAPTGEFNAIKINITGATVGAPGQQAPAPVVMPQTQPLPSPENAGQTINYNA